MSILQCRHLLHMLLILRNGAYRGKAADLVAVNPVGQPSALCDRPKALLAFSVVVPIMPFELRSSCNWHNQSTSISTISYVQYGSVVISAAVRISRMVPSMIREYVPSDSCKIKEVSAGPGMTWLFPRSSDVGWEAGCRMKQYEAKNARTHKIAIRINAFLDRARWGCRATRKRCSNIFWKSVPQSPWGFYPRWGSQAGSFF